MRVEDILSPFALASIARSHALRRRGLFSAVQALLDGGQLGSTALGRSIFGAVTPKHCIKRMDRLLGNHRLHAETVIYFGAIASTVLANM